MLKYDPHAVGYSYGANLSRWRGVNDIAYSHGGLSDLHGNEYVRVKPLNNPDPWLLVYGNATSLYEVVGSDLPALADLEGMKGCAAEIADAIRERVGFPQCPVESEILRIKGRHATCRKRIAALPEDIVQIRWLGYISKYANTKDRIGIDIYSNRVFHHCKEKSGEFEYFEEWFFIPEEG